MGLISGFSGNKRKKRKKHMRRSAAGWSDNPREPGKRTENRRKGQGCPPPVTVLCSPTTRTALLLSLSSSSPIGLGASVTRCPSALPAWSPPPPAPSAGGCCPSAKGGPSPSQQKPEPRHPRPPARGHQVGGRDWTQAPPFFPPVARRKVASPASLPQEVHVTNQGFAACPTGCTTAEGHSD